MKKLELTTRKVMLSFGEIVNGFVYYEYLKSDVTIDC